jgi:hypothetical protein
MIVRVVEKWLAKITEAGVRRRAEFYYRQLDALQTLRQEVRHDLLAESRKHSAILEGSTTRLTPGTGSVENPSGPQLKGTRPK